MDCLDNTESRPGDLVSPMETENDYAYYWLSPEEVEALRRDSIEASRKGAGRFSKILEEKLGFRKG